MGRIQKMGKRVKGVEVEEGSQWEASGSVSHSETAWLKREN